MKTHLEIRKWLLPMLTILIYQAVAVFILLQQKGGGEPKWKP